MEQWTFMQNFRHEIAKPISPDDEHLDYIPTQAVAEYLLNEYELKKKGEVANIEAIIFRSAQHPAGKNIALLGEAAYVQPATAENRKERKPSVFSDMLPEAFGLFLTPRHEGGNPALRVDAGSVEIRQIRGAEFDSVRLVEYAAADDEIEF
jgi:hypothetical protein